MSKPYTTSDSLIKQPLWESFRHDALWWLVAALVSFFFASWLMGGGQSWWPNISYPYTYGGDSFSYQLNIMRNIEAPWYYTSERMGYPFGSIFLDYPASDNGSYAVLKVLGWLFGTSTAAYNLYFLLSFPVVTVATYLVSRSVGLSKPFAVAVALLYCFIPFHIGRIGHLFFTWYFVVPVYIYYGFRLVSNELPFFQPGQALWRRALDGLLLMVLASFGVYYAVFACIVLGVAGLMGSVARTSLKPLLASVLAVGFVVAGVLANVAPSILHAQEHGKNLAAVGRLPLETDLYGLKIAQREFATYYRNSFLLVNENVSASLGGIGSIGFLVLVAALFFTPLGIGARGKILDRRLGLMAVLSMALVVVSTIGGFATFFAIFVSPAIRSWNRTSIFIGFLSLAGLALMGLMLTISRFLRPNRPNEEKLSTYESGEDPLGNANVQFNVRFYVIALIFLLFEVELLFMFPWSIVFGNEDLIKQTNGSWGWFAMGEMTVFVGILILGLAYAWAKGYLDWVRPTPKIPEVKSHVPVDLYHKVNEKYEKK